MVTRAQRISRNLAALTIAQLFSRGFAFVTTVHLARTLLADNFGIVVLGTTILAYAELAVTAGFTSLGMREVARDESSVPVLARAVLTIRLILAFAALGLLGVLTSLLPGPITTKQVVVIYGLSLFTTAIDLAWVFLGLELMRYTALVEILGQAIMTGAVLTLVRSPADTLRVPMIYVVAELVSVAVLMYFYTRRFGRLQLGIDLSVWRSLAVAVAPLAISSAMGMITFNYDTLVVGLTLGTRAAGIYGAAYRVVWVPSLAAATYFTALNPSLSRAYKEGLASVASLLDKSVRLTTAVAFGMGVAGGMLAIPGFELLYGPGFHESILPFQILIWSIALLFVNRNYRNLLIAFDRQRIELRVITAAAMTNVILNLLLIPLLDLAGAAIATVVSEGAILVLGYFYTRRIVGHVPFGRHVPRIVAAAAIMAAILFVTSPLNLFVRIALGGIAYAGALLAFRVVTLEELRSVYNTGWSNKPKLAPHDKQLDTGE